MIRRIIEIDQEKCNGCGACAEACHEGAIAMVDGKAKLTIPEGTQTGSVFRLRGCGVTRINGTLRGDQFITVNVVTPRNLTPEQKEALRAFAAAMNETTAEAEKKGIFEKKRKKKDK